MKWIFRVGLTLSLAISILLLVLLPQILGNRVLTNSEINQIEDVITNYKM
jgi:hypothetical protein